MQNSALITAAQPATTKPERQCYECGGSIGKAQLDAKRVAEMLKELKKVT